MNFETYLNNYLMWPNYYFCGGFFHLYRVQELLLGLLPGLEQDPLPGVGYVVALPLAGRSAGALVGL